MCCFCLHVLLKLNYPLEFLFNEWMDPWDHLSPKGSQPQVIEPLPIYFGWFCPELSPLWFSSLLPWLNGPCLRQTRSALNQSFSFVQELGRELSWIQPGQQELVALGYMCSYSMQGVPIQYKVNNQLINQKLLAEKLGAF